PVPAAESARGGRIARVIRRATEPWRLRAEEERRVVDETIPAAAREELPVVAARLGRPLDDAHRRDVLKRTNGWPMRWHSSWTYKDHPDHLGIPDGHFRHDFGIRLMVKPGWRRIADLTLHYRVLFAHEYTHWLQDEGLVTERWGGEPPAVASEILRAIELAGLPAVEAGRVPTVHEGNLSNFRAGREWARSGGKSDPFVVYRRGGLAGMAYEAGVLAGRPEAAWEFLGMVVSEKNGRTPAEALAAVLKTAR
ncbi:MAG: hypothetical protein KGM24_12250, partial [Elusimicrobia bacterium]|nr:hypothetical protein [Elusimicrobiota bacterium]